MTTIAYQRTHQLQASCGVADLGFPHADMLAVMADARRDDAEAVTMLMNASLSGRADRAPEVGELAAALWADLCDAGALEVLFTGPGSLMRQLNAAMLDLHATGHEGANDALAHITCLCFCWLRASGHLHPPTDRTTTE